MPVRLTFLEQILGLSGSEAVIEKARGLYGRLKTLPIFHFNQFYANAHKLQYLLQPCP